MLVTTNAVENEARTARANSLEQCRHITFLGERSQPSRVVSREKPPRGWRETPSCGLNEESAAFFDALCRTGGVRADRYRDSILTRRQGACLRALRVAGPVEGARALQTDRSGAARALRAVMIGVTAFFRDPLVFQTLRPLLAPLHRRRGMLDVMSVACSDGSELYSLAMLLAEEGLLERSRLLGVDCRADAIAAAQAGFYNAESAATVPPVLRARYLQPAKNVGPLAGGVRASGPVVRVEERLRRACGWSVSDVFDLSAASKPPQKSDLILCRNLAIYLTAESASELWMILASRLRPGGLLVVGKAERPSAQARESLTKIGSCIYRKHAEAL